MNSYYGASEKLFQSEVWSAKKLEVEELSDSENFEGQVRFSLKRLKEYVVVGAIKHTLCSQSDAEEVNSSLVGHESSREVVPSHLRVAKVEEDVESNFKTNTREAVDLKPFTERILQEYMMLMRKYGESAKHMEFHVCIGDGTCFDGKPCRSVKHKLF